MKLKKIYYLNGTHWDREWYKTFQGFRYMLMDVLDEVIDTLEKQPDFKMYMLDGQTAILDDYTEISPENRDRLVGLIKDKRIAVGPWYTMPDEFIPSGESIIRNLLLGHKKAVEYGAQQAMQYGYICDIFGHIAQMPQIFSGFGIHGALIQRGCNQDTCPPHFIWKSPDGTTCTVYRTPEDFGYGAFYHYATEPYNQGWNTSLDDLLERAIKEIDREAATLNAPFLVLDDALDHQHITKVAPWLAEKLAAHYGCEVVFKTLDDLVAELEQYRDDLPVKSGELAETSKLAVGTNILLTYILSSRFDIKKENDLVQNLLEKWAEPLMAMHNLSEKPIRNGYRDVMYKELMRNHAHDSICGCAVEEVHRDMHYRFRQTEKIAEEIIDDCLCRDASRVGQSDGKRIVVRVFNPLPYSGKQTVKIRICFDKDFPAKFSEGERDYEYRPSFELFDKDGNAVPYTLCCFRKNRIHKTPTQYFADYADICISAELEACGYTEFELVPSDKTRRVRYIAGQCVDPLTMQNKYLRVTVEPDGTVSIKNLKTQTEYKNMLYYADDGEIGDGWMHIRPCADKVVYSKGTPAIIEKLYDGPAETAFRIGTELRLPEKMTYDNGSIQRSPNYVTVPIWTTLRLGAENDFLDVETVIENKAMDHRIKVCIPTGIQSGSYEAGQAFTMLKRQTGQLAYTGDWKEPQYGDRNFNGIAVKRGADGNGIAFLSSAGIHEIMAMDDESGTFAITLFRGFHKTVGNNDYEQMDGELLQTLSFSYRLMPVDSSVSEGKIIRCRDFLQAGTRCYNIFPGGDYIIGNEKPFVKLEGENLVCSILKAPEKQDYKSVILRVYNSSDESASGKLTFRDSIAAAYRTDLREEVECAIDTDGSRIAIDAGARKIITVKVEFQK